MFSWEALYIDFSAETGKYPLRDIVFFMEEESLVGPFGWLVKNLVNSRAESNPAAPREIPARSADTWLTRNFLFHAASSATVKSRNPSRVAIFASCYLKLE